IKRLASPQPRGVLTKPPREINAFHRRRENTARFGAASAILRNQDQSGLIIRSPGGRRLRQGQSDLFGSRRRRRLPVEGGVHPLPHLIKPPPRPRGPLAARRGPAAGGLIEGDFHLFAFHSRPFVFSSRLRHGVGQTLSDPRKSSKIRKP